MDKWLRVYTRVVLDWDSPVPLAVNSMLYFGPIAECKGPSSQEKAIAAQQQQLNATLAANYNQQFANQTAVFNAVKAVFDPIFKAGPNQYGFAPAQDAALRTLASEGTAGEYKMASQAVAERMAAAGGGNTLLPSGVQADIQGKVAGAAAESEAVKQLDITKAGYDVGRQNFQVAANAEMGLAAGYNPLGYAGAASSSGMDAFKMAQEINKEQQAASPWGAIGGMLGGIAGSFLGPIGGALGSKVGGMLGGGGGFGGMLGGGGFDPSGSSSTNWGGFAPGESYT